MTTPSDLVIVTPRWQPQGGGCERSVADLVAWLTHQGDRVEVWCRQARAVPGEGVRVIPGGAAALERAMRDHRRRRPEIPLLATWATASASHVQLHAGLPSEAFAAEREAIRSPLRRLLYRPTLALNRRRQRQLTAERALLAAQPGPRVMTFSRGLAARLAGRGVAPERLCCRVPGVDLAVFHPADGSQPPPHPTLLFVAHDFVLKGLAAAIAAVAAVTADGGPPVGLVVVGGGQPGRFRRQAAAAGVGHRVSFHGALPREEVAGLYRASTALLHPTFHDPFSLVVLEALAAGCPVVTTRRCGAAELIEIAGQGLVVDDPAAVEDLARAVATVVTSGDRRAAAAVGRRHPFAEHAAAVRDWLRSGG